MSAAYNHLITSNEFEKVLIATAKGKRIYGVEFHFNDFNIVMTNDGLYWNPIQLKLQFDEIAGTKTKDKNWFRRKYCKSIEDPDFKGDYPVIGGDVWAPVREFDNIVSNMLPKFDNVPKRWLRGLDCSESFHEILYVRLDPRFDELDFIIKIGRKTDGDGRDSNYKQHGRGGSDITLIEYYMRFGSPAENMIKKVFVKAHFRQPKFAPVSGEKLGKEHYHVPNVKTFEELYNRVMMVLDKFYDSMKDDIIDIWCYCLGDSEKSNKKGLKAFDDMYCPKNRARKPLSK